MSGLHGWVAKKTMQPFEFIEIYTKPLCIAILPIKNSGSTNDLQYREIKNLYIKMLSVLELTSDKLSKVFMRYQEKEKFSIEQKKLLTKKISYYSPKCILEFGDLGFLDTNLLNLENIFTIKTFHPEHLLNNPQDKRQAHQDLLLCKKKLAILS